MAGLSSEYCPSPEPSQPNSSHHTQDFLPSAGCTFPCPPPSVHRRADQRGIYSLPALRGYIEHSSCLLWGCSWNKLLLRLTYKLSLNNKAGFLWLVGTMLYVPYFMIWGIIEMDNNYNLEIRVKFHLISWWSPMEISCTHYILPIPRVTSY